MKFITKALLFSTSVGASTNLRNLAEGWEPEDCAETSCSLQSDGYWIQDEFGTWDHKNYANRPG